PLAGDDEAIPTLVTRQGDCFASLAMTNTPPFFHSHQTLVFRLRSGWMFASSGRAALDVSKKAST
ncbi:MAG: hypothetical protein WBF13_02155, partial [Candidatus Zixiibacteriota bacterium]